MHICVLNTCCKFHEDIFWNKKVISIYIVVYLEVSTSIDLCSILNYNYKIIKSSVTEHGVGPIKLLKLHSWT